MQTGSKISIWSGIAAWQSCLIGEISIFWPRSLDLHHLWLLVYRADRLKIAESYLDRLECDIRIMLNTASRVAVASSDDVNDFSAFLLKQEFSFAVSLVSLRARLKLMDVGLRPRIQFDSLLRNLEPLVVRTHALAAAAA